jgi:hypothetical protein
MKRNAECVELSLIDVAADGALFDQHSLDIGSAYAYALEFVC